jgi:hypothetical protein
MTWSPIVELRQYTLVPGKCDVLIDLFDADLIEGQEDTGMKIIGQFRDLDDPDKFVWLRGFPTMPERAQSLGDFYGGPVWQSNREAANATMIDSDDVLLLRPARSGSTFMLDDERSRRGAADGAENGIVEATILHLGAPADARIVEFFEEEIVPRIADAAGSVLAYFVTEPSENTFPSLPVREGENVFVWFAGFGDRASYDALHGVRSEIVNVAHRAPGLAPTPQVLRLAPTSRSLLTASSQTSTASRQATVRANIL